MDFYRFYRGEEFEAHTFLGAHREQGGTVLRTFAPAASKISVIGEWNGWREEPMARIYDGNFWELRTGAAKAGDMYKFRVYDQAGDFMDHADPYAFMSELRPGTASRLYEPGAFPFSDAAWLKKRRDLACGPMHIYELHAGAWKLPDPSDAGRHYSWRELAGLLVPYLKEMHFNFLELMPVTEYPCDESWGYQAMGFFSPTARYGSPDDLKYLIGLCHQNEIGVLLDFVPVHFAPDGCGLSNYDGTPLYEYPGRDAGSSEWGTCNFMHARGEVRSFLQSAACYWLGAYHFDGLRVDAVRNLIYWQGDEARGENRAALQFLRTMNAGIHERFPGALLIAEDSSAFPGVTKPADQGGLGFDYKWDMGWMNDTLSYMQAPPGERRQIYHRLTFSMWYYYNERYLLALSHDEVVHGKAAIVQKMNGPDLGAKFAQARLLYAYMAAHPGGKLNFMGNELGGLWEWTEKKELDWWLVRDRPLHRKFFAFFRELSAVYASRPALYERDYERDGFTWTDCAGEGKRAVYSFVRRGASETVLAVFNFDETDLPAYEVRLPERDRHRRAGAPEIPGAPDGSLYAEKILDTDLVRWGGGTLRERELIPVRGGLLRLRLPRLSAQYYRLV